MFTRALTTATCLSLLAAAPAFAIDDLNSPNLEKGEFEVEYKFGRSVDSDNSLDNDQGHEFNMAYTLTDRFALELGTHLARAPQGETKLEAYAVEGHFQFFEPNKYWADTGMVLAYGHTSRNGTADTVEATLLAQKDIGKFSHVLNVGLAQEVGNDAHGGPEYKVLWGSSYQLQPYFQPAIEVQSGLGSRHTLGKYDHQEHYAGPAVYGELFDHFEYQAAYLFGLSDAATDGALRLQVVYVTHF